METRELQGMSEDTALNPCRLHRLVPAALLALFLVLVAAAPAPAATAGLDGSYGAGGLVQLAPTLPPGLFPDPPYPGIQATFARDGSAYARETVSTCEFEYSIGPCTQSALLFHYGKRGDLDSSFGGSGSVDISEWRIAMAADAGGRVLLTGLDLTAGSTKTSGKVERLLASGRPDKSFGRGGIVNLPQLTFPDVLLPAGHGRVLVGSADEVPGGEISTQRLTLVRLLPDGRLDRSFGSRGSSSFTLAMRPLDSQIAVDRKGSILVLGGLCCEGVRPVYRISPKGRLDTRFNAAARGALGRVGVGGGVELTSLVPRPDGGIDVFGLNGRRSSRSADLGGLMLRLRPDGRLERKFGEGGKRDLALPVVAASPGASGATITVAEIGETVTISQLLPNGDVNPAFGGGSGVQIPQLGIHASVQPLAGGRAGIFGEGFRLCNRGTCISAPYLARVIEASPSRPAGKKGGRS